MTQARLDLRSRKIANTWWPASIREKVRSQCVSVSDLTIGALIGAGLALAHSLNNHRRLRSIEKKLENIQESLNAKTSELGTSGDVGRDNNGSLFPD